MHVAARVEEEEPVDIMEALRASLEQAQGARKPRKKTTRKRSTKRAA